MSSYPPPTENPPIFNSRYFQTSPNLLGRTGPAGPAGPMFQFGKNVYLGTDAGSFSQGPAGIAIGYLSGVLSQEEGAIAIGPWAGYDRQGSQGIAIGLQSGYQAQGHAAIAIGSQSGKYFQGAQSIAIGAFAGYTGQAPNSIILNATDGILNGDTAGFFVAPLKAADTCNILVYDSVNKEIGYVCTGGIGGPQGIQGPQGSQGNQGFQGLQGEQGPQGCQGPQGYQGWQGEQGPQGWQGEQGPQGFQGPQGLDGWQGPQGYQGWQGWQGNQGWQGPQGWQGLKGQQGNQGFQTDKQGNQGFQGLQGWQGFQGVQGWDGTPNLTEWSVNLAYQSLGSGIQSVCLGCHTPLMIQFAGLALTSQTAYFVAVYLPKAMTVTGAVWFQYTQGVYTASNYNGVGLYSQSAGTLTLQASSANDGDTYKQTAATYIKTPFSSTYSAAAGTYYVCFLHSRSATTTAPAIGYGIAFSNAAVSSVDFTNSNKLISTLASQTALPTPTQAASGLTATTNPIWCALY